MLSRVSAGQSLNETGDNSLKQSDVQDGVVDEEDSFYFLVDEPTEMANDDLDGGSSLATAPSTVPENVSTQSANDSLRSAANDEKETIDAKAILGANEAQQSDHRDDGDEQRKKAQFLRRRKRNLDLASRIRDEPGAYSLEGQELDDDLEPLPQPIAKRSTDERQDTEGQRRNHLVRQAIRHVSDARRSRRAGKEPAAGPPGAKSGAGADEAGNQFERTKQNANEKTT